MRISDWSSDGCSSELVPAGGGPVRDLTQDSPALKEVTSHLLLVYENVIAEEAKLDRRLRGMARNDETVRRFMTVPGIGSITSLAYRHAIADPGRFKSAQTVGAYLGMKPRRYQSGNIAVHERVSQRGDRAFRMYF